MQHNIPHSILVDRTNYDELKQDIIDSMAHRLTEYVGIDLETEDSEAHEGIKAIRKEDAAGKSTGKGKLVFDFEAINITGLSIYVEGHHSAYYFNLMHSDVENRLEWEEVREILDAKKEDAHWIAHHAPFELSVLKKAVDYDLFPVICTLQMAVSTYGPDEYEKSDYLRANLGEIPSLYPQVKKVFSSSDDKDEDQRFSYHQNEVLQKALGKQSVSAHSYNGLVRDLSYSYGLKKMVEKFFNYKMATFDETLGDADNMGQLTGAQVTEYGCEDSFWAVKLWRHLTGMILKVDPEGNLFRTFLTQENPMIYVFSQIRMDGMNINLDAVAKRRMVERGVFAKQLRELKAVGRRLLPFPDELNQGLMKRDKWYADARKGEILPKGVEYRKRLQDWLESDDCEDDFEQACQVSSAVSNAWAGHKIAALNLTHYFQIRLMIYDLTRMEPLVAKGKVQSDADARGVVRDRIQKLLTEDEDSTFLKDCDEMIRLIGEISGVDQRMKLYLNPYTNLTNPVTKKIYPEVSSMLATRRMACANPNAMQLAKRGESTYVRGFYEADDEDHLMVSLDWSQVELVEIGEFSGDPEFAKAYGQLPYQDLHLGAAADILKVMIPEVDMDMLKNMHNMDAQDLPEKLLIKPNGETLSPKQAKKFWRTAVGKGANFNYWYSGALSTVGDTMGWTSTQMWEATERYRERFPIAEQWRKDIIEEAKMSGKVILPDHHIRYKWEATYEWANFTNRMFKAANCPAIEKFGAEVVRATRNRAGNQLVNAMIQGSSATLAKRSILRINEAIAELGLRAKFKMPVHDELIFSVHHEDVIQFLRVAKGIMADHPDIIKNLKLYSTASIGFNFEPFDEDTAPLGQVELDECPEIFGYGDDAVLTIPQIEELIQTFFRRREELRNAA